jgi:hypothetical protein
MRLCQGITSPLLSPASVRRPPPKDELVAAHDFYKVQETGNGSKRRLELDLCASWVVSQKIAKGTKSFVVFVAFCQDHGQSSFRSSVSEDGKAVHPPQYRYGGRERRIQNLGSSLFSGTRGIASRAAPEATSRPPSGHLVANR